MRPTVSVVCPYLGPAPRFDLELRDGDELLLGDNNWGPRSSYWARGVAAAKAKGEWLVFIDADCVPDPSLVDAYLDPPPADDVGVLAGGIEDTIVEDTVVARWIAARAKLSAANTLDSARPYAQTANCAVRRSAYEAVGGFTEAVRSGGDADLCWRLAEAGWRIEPRPRARVAHRNRSRVRDVLAQLHRHGSGMAWLDERWPGSFPAPSARELVGRTAMLWRAESLAFGALDVAGLWARDLGRLRTNR